METNELVKRLSKITKTARTFILAAAKEYIANPDNKEAMDKAYKRVLEDIIVAAGVGQNEIFFDTGGNIPEAYGTYLYVIDEIKKQGFEIEELDMYGCSIRWPL